jgi:4-amino-4-deoxy-L-arabinose transferase-like glycosyltransferase
MPTHTLLGPESARPATWKSFSFWLPWIGWTCLCGISFFWKLGYPSFWDPDEAVYAQSTREMLASGNLLVPMFNGQLFLDKPVLFYLLQMVPFAVLGPTEFAARLVPALAAVGLIAFTGWLGGALFDRRVGRLGALLLALMPATFALVRYAILDMLFTLFLFGGVALVAVAAFRDRPRLQYGGYVLLALAVLVKGPLALVLCGLTWLLVLALSSSARRRLLALRWVAGLAIIVAVAMPWFLYMWARFGWPFIEGYLLRENIWLYSKPLFGRHPGRTFYLRVLLSGLLPITPLLLGHVGDTIRRLVQRVKPTVEEGLLWAWVAVIVGFFTMSSFMYDHYIYPAAPALCLLMALAWTRAATGRAREHAGAIAGLIGIGPVLVVLGAAFFHVLLRPPLAFEPAAWMIPGALLTGGIVFTALSAIRRSRVAVLASLLAAIVVLAHVGLLEGVLPGLEREKPVRELAQWMATHAGPNDVVAAYHMNRWTSGWRFYVNRPALLLEHHDHLIAAMNGTTRVYCAMREDGFEQLRSRGLRLRIAFERRGLSSTTRRGRFLRLEPHFQRFLVVTNER